MDIAQTMESADKQACNFKNSPTPGAVYSLSGARPKDKNRQKENFAKRENLLSPVFVEVVTTHCKRASLKKRTVTFVSTKDTLSKFA